MNSLVNERMAKWLGAGALSLALSAGALSGSVAPAFAAANMTVSVQESVSTIGVGEQMTYTFTVRNAGDRGDANVVLSGRIFDGTLVGSIQQVGTPRFDGCAPISDRSFRCTGGFFDINDQAVVKVKVKAPAQPGTMRARGSLNNGIEANENPQGDIDSESTTVVRRPDITTSISGTDFMEGIGTDGEWTVKVRNAAGASLAKNVKLVVDRGELPIDFNTFDIIGQAQGFSCTATSERVTCTGGDLSAGETFTIRAGASGNLGMVLPRPATGRITVSASVTGPVKESITSNNGSRLTLSTHN